MCPHNHFLDEDKNCDTVLSKSSRPLDGSAPSDLTIRMCIELDNSTTSSKDIELGAIESAIAEAIDRWFNAERGKDSECEHDFNLKINGSIAVLLKADDAEE
jgi:hypothetical protein